MTGKSEDRLRFICDPQPTRAQLRAMNEIASLFEGPRPVRKRQRTDGQNKPGSNASFRARQIADVRRDFLHKASSTISQNHAIVCVEDLQVASMSKSAKGTAERPGIPRR